MIKYSLLTQETCKDSPCCAFLFIHKSFELKRNEFKSNINFLQRGIQLYLEIALKIKYKTRNKEAIPVD